MGRYDLFRKMASSNLNQKGREVKTIKDSIIYDFKSSPSYVQGYINNDIADLRDFHIITDRLKNTKKLLSYPNKSFNVGDVIDIVDLNAKFLVIDLDEDQQIQTKGTIQSCNNTLKFYAPNESTNLWESKEIPCIIGNITLNTDETKYMPTVDNSLKLIVSNNEINRQIKLNQIYKIGLNNYKIISVADDISTPGLLQFKLEYSEVEQIIPSHNYSISILNGDSATLSQGEILQLNIQITDNGNIISPTPQIIYSSDNESILTVDNNGTVTAIGVGGNATITATYEELSDSINISIKIEPQHNYTVDINTSGTLKINQSITATAIFKDNGVQISDVASSWWVLADDGVSPTNLVTITYEGNTCNIKAGSTTGYIRLYVGGYNCQGSIRLQVSSLW